MCRLVPLAFVIVAFGCRPPESEHIPREASSDPDPPPLLEPNDVSILMTLPESPAERADYLYLMTEGSLFPAGLEQELPSLFSTPPGPLARIYQDMQVTAFRFVPCPSDDSEAGCVPQIRLIAQLVAPTDQGEFLGDEVALHLFYSLSSAEAEALAGELLDLNRASPRSTLGQPLFVHPALVAEGMGGSWGERLRAMVRTYARADALVRVTSTGFVFDSWPFQDARVENGHVVMLAPIRHTEEAEPSTQSWDIFSDGDTFGHTRPLPAIEAGTTFFATTSNYYRGGAPRGGAEVQAAVGSLERILNPTIHSAESVDCVSCHAARFVKHRARELGIAFDSSESYLPPLWANVERAQDLSIEGRAANVVQFGYFLRRSANEGVPGGHPMPSVSERVIYDSIVAAELASDLLMNSGRFIDSTLE